MQGGCARRLGRACSPGDELQVEGVCIGPAAQLCRHFIVGTDDGPATHYLACERVHACVPRQQWMKQAALKGSACQHTFALDRGNTQQAPSRTWVHPEPIL